jgi:hypothetical protein
MSEGPIPIPSAIIINGVKYVPGALLYSGSRGYEWECVKPDGLAYRVCHAPNRKVGALVGRNTRYEWEDSNE